MDYPAKARLKIFSKTEIVELKDNPDLYALLNLNDYKFRAERMMVFNNEAFDWDCPQHITPRFTMEEIQAALQPQQEYMAELEEENKRLKDKLNRAGL